MKIRFTNYEVVVADSIGKLEVRVNEKLQEGKIPLGGVSIVIEPNDPDYMYSQAMAVPLE
jgi:hypothetical protein